MREKVFPPFFLQPKRALTLELSPAVLPLAAPPAPPPQVLPPPGARAEAAATARAASPRPTGDGCLAPAAACLAYLYDRPRAPLLDPQPLAPVRLRLGNSSAVSAMDATATTGVVSWNPNEQVAFRPGTATERAASR